MKIEETGQKRITLYRGEVVKLLESLRDDYSWDSTLSEVIKELRSGYRDTEFSFLTDAEEY